MTTPAPLAPGPIASGARPARHPRRWAVAALVVAAVLAVVAVAQRGEPAVDEGDGPHGPEVVLIDRTAVVASPDGGAPDLVAITVDDDRRPLWPRQTLVRAGFDGEVRWRRYLGPEASPTVLEAETGIVLVSDVGDPMEAALLPSPTDLVALDLDDGTVRWRTTVTPAAEPWIDGDRVLVPGEDGALSALDVADGEEVWAFEDPANTSTAAPSVDTVDDETVLVTRTRSDYGVELVPVSLEDGSEGPAFAPSCDGGEADEERATATDRVVPVPGTTDAVAVFGQNPQCVQRWDTSTGEPRWGIATIAATADFGDRAPSPRALALDEDHLAFDGADGVFVVDLDDGTHRLLERADDGIVAPLFVVNGSVVAATVDADGAKADLDGWAADGTATRWDGVTVGDPDGAAPLIVERRGAFANSDAGVPAVVADTAEGVVRTISLDGVDGGQVGTLDPATGEVDERPYRLHADREQLAGTTLSMVQIVDDWAVVVVTGLPHLVDLDTGEVVASWPVGRGQA